MLVAISTNISLAFWNIQNEEELFSSFASKIKSDDFNYKEEEKSGEALPTKGTKRRFTNIKQKWTRVDVLRKKAFRASIWVAVDHFKITLLKLYRNPIKKMTLLFNELKNQMQIITDENIESNQQFIKVYFFLAKKLLQKKFKSTMTR